MNKFTFAMIALVSVFLIATANAEQTGAAAPAAGQEPQASQAAPKKKAVGSRRQKAQKEVNEAKIERDAIKSGDAGKKPAKTKLSRRNKAVLEQKEQANMRQKTIRSEASATAK